MNQSKKEYIERHDMFDNSVIFSVYTKEYGTIEVIPLEHLINLPTIDIAERAEGVWIPVVSRKISKRQFVCSNCERVQENIVKVHNYRYCPQCGASMHFVGEVEKEWKSRREEVDCNEMDSNAL